MTYHDLIRTIRSSAYDPAFYAQARSHTLAAPIKVLSALGVFAIGILLVIAYSGLVAFAFSDFPERAQATYPDGLDITLAHGELSINQPLPYYVESPFTEKMLGTSSPKYLAIFDTEDTLGADLDSNSTFALIKKTYAIVKDSNTSGGSIQKFPTDSATSTLTKADVVAFVTKARPYFTPGLIIGGLIATILGIIIGCFFWIVFHMIYVLIPALVIMVFMMLRKTPLTYGEAYLTALYASIPVAIFTYFLASLGLPLPQLGYSLLLLAVAIINLTQPTTPATPSTP